MTCGCGHPNDDHGDPRNLTLDAFIQAAESANLPLTEAVGNVADTYEGLINRSEAMGRD